MQNYKETGPNDEQYLEKSVSSSKTFIYRYQSKAIIGIVLLFLVIAFDLSSFQGNMGNIRFYTKWAECGQKPLHITSASGAGFAWYTESPSIAIMRASGPYYCTPQEAKAAGYASSQNGY